MRFSKILFLFLWVPLQGQQLGFALEQINGKAILNEGLTGKGVKIGIVDGGFLHANKKETLSHLFNNNLVAAYKDYLDSADSDYAGSKILDDGHGTEVWEMIAGYNASKDIQYGLATGATFYLARTDHGRYERREEEKNAIQAMEWMASEGVRIINISLGYNYGFTNKAENYKPSQMDGKSTILTQAVDRISKEYDILFIVAAGNDGEKKWRIIDSPADAKSALTVGATKFKTWDDMSYSSKGPEWLDYVKPEISCFASSGTSFSTPIITGLAACILEKKPDLKSDELKQIIIKSSSLEHPNNYVGHGVPDGERALQLVEGQVKNTNHTEIHSTKNSYKLDLKERIPYLSIYHKNKWRVLKKEKGKPKSNAFKIKKMKDATSSTVIWEGGSLEIFWTD